MLTSDGLAPAGSGVPTPAAARAADRTPAYRPGRSLMVKLAMVKNGAEPLWTSWRKSERDGACRPVNPRCRASNGRVRRPVPDRQPHPSFVPGELLAAPCLVARRYDGPNPAAPSVYSSPSVRGVRDRSPARSPQPARMRHQGWVDGSMRSPLEMSLH